MVSKLHVFATDVMNINNNNYYYYAPYKKIINKSWIFLCAICSTLHLNISWNQSLSYAALNLI